MGLSEKWVGSSLLLMYGRSKLNLSLHWSTRGTRTRVDGLWSLG